MKKIRTLKDIEDYQVKEQKLEGVGFGLKCNKCGNRIVFYMGAREVTKEEFFEFDKWMRNQMKEEEENNDRR